MIKTIFIVIKQLKPMKFAINTELLYKMTAVMRSGED